MENNTIAYPTRYDIKTTIISDFIKYNYDTS